MIEFVCSGCSAGFQISGTWFKIQELLVAHPIWLKRDKACPYCTGLLVRPTPTLNRQRAWRCLDVDEFFRALCGFGLPEELDCTPESVNTLIQSNPIVGVDMAAAGGDRTAVFAINLSNDLKLHLVSSPDGPCIYKITRTTHGNCDSSHLSTQAPDSTVQCTHQGISSGGQEANPSQGVGDVVADIHAESAGRVEPTDTPLQTNTDLDAGHSVGTATGGSSNSTCASAAT